MIDSLALRWALTVILTAATLGSISGGGRSRTGRAPGTTTLRISSAAHAFMGVAMITMLWPGGTVMPGGLEAIVFAVTAGWFFRLASGVRPPGSAPRWPDLHHALMAVAMIWMALAMPVALPTTGMAGHQHSPHGDTSAPMGMPALLLIAGVVLAGYFLLAVVLWLSHAGLGLHITSVAGAPRRSRRAFEAASHAVSSAVMSVIVLGAL
ncbi:DUF5134 domain-containing protein [Nonomuraea sp. 3-1Str]|uniref:DUF5134 domain-containing protein n=1 Tax=Nonomuraea sp. 3-1Str TaxID=2929801 RepID=UPI00285C7B86|nr:DUF5134 domain-containing protein [Nonomuraea sp. 3-1Str]MDR8413695.1 DUF5134 domain-containing protein [Nonomuraea sp. 3-1Str]